MPRRSALILAPLLLTLFGVLIIEDRAEGAIISLLPIQNRAGDSLAATSVDQILRFELSNHGQILGPEPTRDALRRLRIRNGDRASPAVLRQLSEQLGADWLVSATLHDADRRLVPRLTLSARVYSGVTGELVWAGFQGGSGIDRRKVLGLGRIEDLESLVPFVVANLLSDLPSTTSTESSGSRPQRSLDAQLGLVAIVPFAGSTKARATANAETVTEAARAQLFRTGVDVVSPNITNAALRQSQEGQWGGVATTAREALHGMGGADRILTGAVESYDVAGSELEPEPRVTIALRLLDAKTGRILWTGSMERKGWDRQGLFALGRIYSRGALAERIMEKLGERLARDFTKNNSG